MRVASWKGLLVFVALYPVSARADNYNPYLSNPIPLYNPPCNFCNPYSIFPSHHPFSAYNPSNYNYYPMPSVPQRRALMRGERG